MADDNNQGASAEDTAAVIATAVATAVAANNARIGGLRKLASAHGASDADLDAAIDGNTTVEAFALSLADKAATAKADTLAALAADETAAGKVAASGAKEPEEKTVDAVVTEITTAAAAARGQAK